MRIMIMATHFKVGLTMIIDCSAVGPVDAAAEHPLGNLFGQNLNKFRRNLDKND